MNVRQFGLKNAKSKADEMYDLMDMNHFFESPEGLGWGMNPTTERIGQTFIVTKEEVNQPSPSGTMWFPTYEEYEKFLRFCQVGGIILCYKPSDEIGWRYLDCSADLKKSEIDHDTGYLSCGITFKGTSRWYEDPVLYQSDESIQYDTKQFLPHEGSAEFYYAYIHNDDPIWNHGDETSDGEKADETYYYYKYVKSDVFVGIENGSIDSYFTLTIFGPCENPFYRLYQNGVVIHEGRIRVSLNSNQKLVINTHPKSMEISTYTVADRFLENVYGKSDFETERIFALPPGSTSMAVSDDEAHTIIFNVEVKRVV